MHGLLFCTEWEEVCMCASTIQVYFGSRSQKYSCVPIYSMIMQCACIYSSIYTYVIYFIHMYTNLIMMFTNLFLT
jgi:hypothetical protein